MLFIRFEISAISVGPGTALPIRHQNDIEFNLFYLL